VNVGCGRTPTAGWINFDNSLTVRLARVPVLWTALEALHALTPAQRAFVEFARSHDIRYADAAKRLPLADGSVDALYTSHMLEHLDRGAATTFLAEAHRVLRAGGILRVGVPDLGHHVARYQATGDADRFLEAIMLSAETPRRPLDRIKALVVGARHHRWMYDGESLRRLLDARGFAGARITPAGTTMIEEPGGLDLAERDGETVVVEAVRP
jgi:predicted SAM-dependent methyltransferase